MAGMNRSALIAKLTKVLKQRYKPVTHNSDRPLLEQMLFACCLENAPHDKAEKTYEHLRTSFFDWNEVRVSTVKELAEAMRDLPDPNQAASNLKSVLQNVFEATYSFDLESVKKQNIGVGIKRLAKMEGASPFVVAYVTQHALGGHSIPLDRGALDVLYIIGLATEAERQSSSVAGLERAIPKNKGAEFASLLHQLAAEFVANPFAPAMKTLLLGINPEGKDRYPKRGQKKPPVPPASPLTPAKTPIGKSDGKTAAGKAADGKTADKKGAAAKLHDHVSGHEKAPGKKEFAKDTKKATTAKSCAAEPPAKKSPHKKAASAKPARTHGSTASRPAARSAGLKSATKHLAKRKPR
jgi:endonuclease III